MAPAQPSKHIVLISIPAWGHTRPLLALAGRIATEDKDTVLTILVPPNVYDKAAADLSAQDEAVHNRIRLLTPFTTDNPDLFSQFSTFDEHYPSVYQKLVHGEPIQCAKSGITYDPVPPPRLVIGDFFAIKQPEQTRAITGSSVPVIAFATGGATAMHSVYHQQPLFLAAAEAEVKKNGTDWAEAATQAVNHTEGRVIQLPGLPPIYDYEFHPQVLPFKVPIGPILIGCNQLLAATDGIILGSSSTAIEPIAIEALLQAFSPTPVFTLGPIFPENFWKPKAIETVPEKDQHFVKFLDDAEKKHGSGSVLLLSFGTVFWPSNLEYVEEIIEALLETKFPFIFAHASPFASIPEHLVKRVEQSGLGLLSSWAPQQLILNHKATGWFLTHGGAGGVTESLSSGVPLILYPFDADQPQFAKLVKHSLKVGFELDEVKTGLGPDQPIHDTGRAPAGTREAVGKEFRDVISKIRGEEGRAITARARDIQSALKKTWNEDGAAREGLRSLLNRFT